MNLINDLLSKITIYRLMLYYLTGLIVIAALLSLFGFLSFGFLPFAFSTGFLLAVTWATNYIFAGVFVAGTQTDAALISGLILALVLTPAASLHDLGFLFWAAVLSMASKYILAINEKHFFNPVAIGLVITSFTLNASAHWWVGTSFMLPAVLLGGVLILIKYRRFGLFASFLAAALITILGLGLMNGNDLLPLLIRSLRDTPLLFSGFVMLTEPVTTPPTSRMRIYYGSLMGFLFAPQLHLGPVFSTPEMSITLANLFSYYLRQQMKRAAPVATPAPTPTAPPIPNRIS